MSQDLTLYEVDSSLLELLAAKEDIEAMLAAATEQPGTMSEAERGERIAELAEVDRLLIEYRNTEVARVDKVRGFLLHARLMIQSHKEERDRQAALAQQWERREKWVKEMVAAVIQHEPGRKMLEGRSGQLRLKANGGKVPVIVHNPELLPAEVTKYHGWIAGDFWERIRTAFPGMSDLMGDYSLEREPSLSTIAALLATTCRACEGKNSPTHLCPHCGGSGSEPVPGASLGQRGVHVEIK